jgi:glycosyltransferase involved in cell wall biosynthesis
VHPKVRRKAGIALKVLLDARMIGKTGVGTYIRNLLEAYAGRPGELAVYAVINRSDSRYVRSGSNVSPIVIPRSVPVYSPLEQVVLPYYCRKVRPDLVHFANFNCPFFCPSTYVVTIHDLIYYLYPEACPNRLGHLYAKAVLKSSAKKARLVITDSNASKKDIVANLGVPGEKVRVIHIGISERYRPVPDPRGVLEKYNLPSRYILYVGNHEPRKNLSGLIKAYAASGSSARLPLVIAGKKDPRRSQTYELISKLSLGDRVVLSGYIPTEDLPALYTAARLFVFPSFYEGFGLPPLEAMACGTPVVCSSAASLPEIVGDAAITVDPEDTKSLAAAMDRVLADDGLAEELVRRGLKQAKKTDPADTAKKTIDVYRQALER